jgi:predicted DsbA family dithiol-disulfide isomerase
VRDAVDDDQLERELRERFDAARERGVTGIPTFAYGEHAARGAVPPEQLRRLVDG